MSAQKIIEMSEVRFAAQDREIVRDFSMGFEEGEATALVGPSGSGKSTVLKLAAGLLVPGAGTVRYRGQDVAAMSRRENLEFHRETAVVFQDSALWANQTLYQILELPLRIHFPGMGQGERDRRIRETAREAGYRGDLSLRPAMLSMGEQKLIAFARAMMTRPRLLFLDEWTESLDDASALRLVALVERGRREGGTVIFVSHDFNLTRRLADRVVMVLGGRLFLQLSREEMAADEDLARYVERGIGS